MAAAGWPDCMNYHIFGRFFSMGSRLKITQIAQIFGRTFSTV
jgi:hypothetical protein